MTLTPTRIAWVDAMKAVASQLIVLHHLAFYWPVSDAAHSLAPAILGWLSAHARIAVQVFLVVGGFLAAKSLVPHGRPLVERPLVLVWKRYRRLAMPYMAAIALAIACAAIARHWAGLESAPAPASAMQLLAHLLLLQDLLGHEALSAGVWYVAIDFQLYVSMVFLFWLAQQSGADTSRFRHLAPTLVCVLIIVSLFHFNRNAAWDVWALYFFGAYGLGVLAYWASRSKSPSRWLGAIAAIGLAALLVDYRSRIALALAIALLLGIGRHPAVARSWLEARPVAFLGRISYSVFLVHYPVSMVTTAAFTAYAPGNPLLNAFGLIASWGACTLAGTLFYRYIEMPAGAWLAGKDAPSPAGNGSVAR